MSVIEDLSKTEVPADLGSKLRERLEDLRLLVGTGALAVRMAFQRNQPGPAYDNEAGETPKAER